MRINSLVLAALAFSLVACGHDATTQSAELRAPEKSAAPLAQQLVSPPQDATRQTPAQQMLQDLEGLWTLRMGRRQIGTITLHYREGKLLTTGAWIEPDGELDADNHQLPVKMRNLPQPRCSPEMLSLPIDKYNLDDLNVPDEPMSPGDIMVVTALTLDGSHYGGARETPADINSLSVSVSHIKQAMIADHFSQCRSNPPISLTMTIKNSGQSGSILPIFLFDDGTQKDLSFIRKITSAEARDIEKAYDGNGQEIAKYDVLVAARDSSYLTYLDSIIAKLSDKAAGRGGQPIASATAIQAAPTAAVPAEASTGTLKTSTPDVIAPSFDCTKASSRVEILICSDKELAKADSDLSAAYKRALTASGANETFIRQEQRAFVAKRNRCADSACVAEAYRVRYAEFADLR